MKKNLTPWLCAGISLILCTIFALIFISYWHPMKNQVYDLSLEIINGEESIDVSAQRGWTVFICQGDVKSILTSDGAGCFYPLSYPGQTFYFSRVMQEEMDVPTLCLSAVNRNFSVFLDNELIYTDCPEQNNRIGFLSLPMRDFDRTSDVIIALPENYLGRTLTIAQSSPGYSETPLMAARAYPCKVSLYCSYAYESELIAESFRTAVTGGICFILGLLLLAIFVRRSALGNTDFGLLMISLIVFLYMTFNIYCVSYSVKYFNILSIDIPARCSSLSVAILLFFFAYRAGRMRWISYCIAALYSAGILADFLLTDFKLIPNLHHAIVIIRNVTEYLSIIGFLTALIMGWIFWRKETFFYKIFSPLMTAELVLYTLVRTPLFISEFMNSPATHIDISTLLNSCTHHLTGLTTVVILLFVFILFVQDEVRRFTEKKLILKMGIMAQQRYEALRNQNENIMMLRHDMNKHFQYIRSTTSDPNTMQYIDELIGQSEQYQPVMQCGNEALDIIINSRLNTAAKSGIRIELVRTKAPEILTLSDADLCSLFMNLMDNAVEAARTCGSSHPYLKLDLHIKNDFFVFVCENSATPNRHIEDNKKETVSEHGFGLKIVHQIAERYGYLIHTESGDHFYKTSLAIPLPHPSK